MTFSDDRQHFEEQCSGHSLWLACLRTGPTAYETGQLIQNVGPVVKMRLELAPRLNLITGDNGLGKSFLLDVAWWALTCRWPHNLNPRLTSGYPARPSNPKRQATRLAPFIAQELKRQGSLVRGD